MGTKFTAEATLLCDRVLVTAVVLGDMIKWIFCGMMPEANFHDIQNFFSTSMT